MKRWTQHMVQHRKKIQILKRMKKTNGIKNDAKLDATNDAKLDEKYGAKQDVKKGDK